ncbi:MAG: tetratricopeptide repeat protein [Bacteroidia bacterium]
MSFYSIFRPVKLALPVVLYLLFQSSGFAKPQKIDSLLNRIKTGPDDSTKVKHYDLLCRQYQRAGHPDKGLQAAREGLRLTRIIPTGNENQWTKGVGICLNDIGVMFEALGNYDSALVYEMHALEIRKKISDRKGEAQSQMCLGVLYYKQSNFDMALEYYYEALHYYQKTGDKVYTNYVYNSMGAIYGHQKKWDKALDNFNESLKINKEAGNKEGIADAYSNIGAIYAEQHLFKQALSYQQESMKMRKEAGNKEGVASSLNNMAVIEYGLHDYSKAVEDMLAALEIRKELGDKQAISESCYNLSATYLKINKLEEAQKYALLDFNMAKETGSKEDLRGAYEALALCDSAKSNWKGAFLNEALFKKYNDSIFNSDSDKKMAEMNARYDSEKKEAKIMAMEKDRKQQEALSEASLARHRTIQYSFILGLALLSVFSFFMYNRWRITRRQKGIIERQKKLVDEQKAIVEEKNKDITDSITYARRIQQAKLPGLDDIKNSLPRSFVLFKPKDIVSGDFYFFHKDANRTCLAAADCTGHGVPGAFMSMIGMDKLDLAVQQETEVSTMLSVLNREIKNSLRQSDRMDSTRDGMDIALCVIDPVKRKLTYAGANRPLWLIRNGMQHIEEWKATKKAIGGLTPDDTSFDAHEITCNPGDTFYIFSDGYADLFGGPDNKKITTRKFKEMLLGMQHLSMEDQQQALNTFADTWKGDTEQVDDVLVIGVRW